MKRRLACWALLAVLCAGLGGGTASAATPAGWGAASVLYTGWATYPSVSADGSAVVFIDPWAGADDNHRPVLAMRRSGAVWGAAQTVGSNGVYQTGSVLVLPQFTHPMISGDGQTIAYLGHTGAEPPGVVFAAYLSERTGDAWGAPSVLPTGLSNTHYWMALSGNGQQVTYSSYSYWDASQTYVSARGVGDWGTPTRVTDATYGGYQPSLSADGRKIAFISNARLFFVEQVGGNWSAPQQLTSNQWSEYQVENVRLTADGASIFYWLVKLQDAGGYYLRVAQDLYVMRRSGGVWQAPTRVTATPVIPATTIDAPAAVDGGGTRVIYSRPLQQGDSIVSANLELTEFSDGAWSAPVALTAARSMAFDRNPALSSDGLTLVYDTNALPGMWAAGLAIMQTDTAPPPLPKPAQVWAVIPTTGGSLESPSDGVSYLIPAGAFTDTITITHTIWPAGSRLPQSAPLAYGGLAFTVTAVYADGRPAQPAPGQVFTVTVPYGEPGPAIASGLGLWRWGGAAWTQEGISGTVDTGARIVTARLGHLSLFALLGPTKRVALPLVLR